MHFESANNDHLCTYIYHHTVLMHNIYFIIMEASTKALFLLGLLLVLAICTNGAGECPNSTPDNEAMKLAPCASAVQDAKAAVSSSCCAQVKKLGQNPKCLCAVMLSNMAKMAGIDPQIAIGIPKRCNLADRPVGYKCGAYTLP